MRRNEFAITDSRQIEAFLMEQRWGVLSLHGDDGYPYAVPLNYLYAENRIYFHSAPAGRKLDLLRDDDPPVQFTVVKEYAYIPSYASGAEMACSASQFFKSVLIRGRAVAIEALPEKIAILEGLMRAFQPEGQYQPLAPESESYRRMAAGTGLFMIQPEQISAKFKFGQHLPDEVFQRVTQYLQERGTPLDQETVQMMARYRPK